jgi:hypothetical protein
MVAFPGIATFVVLVFIGLAFYEADVKGRIIVFGLAAITFLLPLFIHSLAMPTICFVARILLGIGCLVYWKWTTTYFG